MTAGESASARRRTPVGAVVLIVLGSLLTLIALGLLAGGGGVLWADKTQRDASGFFTTSAQRFATGSYALTHEGVKITDLGWIRPGKFARVRITATSAEAGKPVFLGIASESALAGYLGGVRHAEVTDIHYDPFSATYAQADGSATPAPPATRKIWAVSATGGAATVTWPLESGRWSVVVMNADGSPAVAADLRFGVDVSYLGWIAAGLFVGGGLVLGLAALLLTLGIRGLGRGPKGGAGEPAAGAAPTGAAPTGAAPSGGATPSTTHSSPVAVEARLDEPLSRWLWLVKWLLAIPHFIVLAFLWLAFVVLSVLALFAIFFTGRYPRGIFDFNLGVLRWSWRVTYYATAAIGTDRYPPFSLADDPEYPARLSVEYPAQLSRGLALVKWWLLAIPHYLVIAVFVGGWGVRWASLGLIELLVVIAGGTLLFTGRYPRSLWEFLLGLNRWIYRVMAYAALMTDVYPPFRLDLGGDEPPAAVSPPVVPAGV